MRSSLAFSRVIVIVLSAAAVVSSILLLLMLSKVFKINKTPAFRTRVFFSSHNQTEKQANNKQTTNSKQAMERESHQTYDEMRLHRGENLIYGLFGNQEFLDKQVKAIKASFGVDDCLLDIVDLDVLSPYSLSSPSSSRKSVGVAPTFIETASKPTDASLSLFQRHQREDRRIVLVKHFNKVFSKKQQQQHQQHDNYGDLLNLNFVFKLTDKTSPVSNVICLVEFDTDFDSDVDTDTIIDKSSLVVSNWKSYIYNQLQQQLQQQVSSGRLEFNVNAFVGRFTRALIQNKNDGVTNKTCSKYETI